MASEQPDPARILSPAQKTRIWVTHCAFKKNGFPSLGSFGSTVRPVVIMPLETWKRLCVEIPELGQRQFEVGAEE